MNNALTSVYYNINSPAGFSNVQKLHKHFKGKYNKKQIQEWLSKQKTYTLHKPVIYKFSRRRIYTRYIDHIWEMDLIQLNLLSKFNDGYKYILVIIDTFSKYVWAYPLKSKKPDEVLHALKNIFTTTTRRPLKIRSDRGGEFVNKKVSDFFTQHKIIHYLTTDAHLHASIVERVNRTIKGKIFKFLTSKSSNRYIDVLSNVIKAYNRTWHRSIKMTPLEVNKSNEKLVKKRLYPKEIKSKTPKYKKGDIVHISHNRKPFKKGYLPLWTTELFIIKELKKTNPPTYVLKDLMNDIIVGSFYEPELQIFTGNLSKQQYEIETILKTRNINGKKEIYVKWKDYPPKFNEWIAASHIKTI